jgi:predicted PurR-regulated permease PerM
MVRDLNIVRKRRAVSVAISNVILTSAVIAVGFVVLLWTQHRSSAFQAQYSEAVSTDIAKLKERLVFEYVSYNGDCLTVYLLNCGAIDDVTIKTVYVYFTGNGTLVKMFSSPILRYFGGTMIADKDLDRGEEGYFMLSPLSLKNGVCYSIRIVTGRGSIFDYAFIA